MMQAMRMRRPRLLPLLTGYGTGEIENTTSSTNNVYLDGNGHLVLKAISSGGGHGRPGGSRAPGTTSRPRRAGSWR